MSFMKSIPWRRLMLIPALLFLSNCAYYNTLFNAKQHYENGLKTMRNNADQAGLPATARTDFEKTIEKCWKLIEIYSDENGYADDALLYIARSEFHLGKFLNSRNHLEKFLQKYPDSELVPEAKLWIGKSLLKEAQIEEANKYFREVIEEAKKAKLRSQANFELGRYAFDQGDYAASIDYLNTALKEKIDDEYKALLLFYLGESFFIQKQYDEAIEQYRNVARYKPTLDIEYKSGLNLGRAYTATRQHKKSYETLRRMLTAPRFKNFEASIKTTMAKNFYAEGEREEALELFKEVVENRRSNPGTAEAAFTLGRIYEGDLNNLDSAVVYYGKVRQLFSKYDSVDVAVEKEQFLKDYKVIRGAIHEDERLVYRLTNDSYFRDSLYQAQYDDSVRIALGLPSAEDLTAADTLDSLGYTQMQLDSLRSIVGSDSVDRLIERKNTEWQILKRFRKEGYVLESLPKEFDEVNLKRMTDREFLRLFETFETRITEERERLADGSEEGEGNNPPQGGEIPEKGVPEKILDPDKLDENKPKPLEKRKLPQIEFDLMNSHFQLAEFYLLKVEDFDSARHHYENFLATYEDSVLTPKAIYSLRYIYSHGENPDPAKVGELEGELLRNYPASPFAREILIARGEYTETAAVEDTVLAALEKQFKLAEGQYFDGDFEAAIEHYRMIASADTTLEISAQARYAIAWIYENDLNEPEKALDTYETILKRYPSATDYVSIAKKKTTPIVESTSPDTDTEGTGDTDGDDQDSEDSDHIKFEDILAEKIQWRVEREPASFR
ncbi:MAG: tetratricopeptide repeat protein [Calditrichaeota bacterium]|nr:tetratricopeptide repeat protein [Calditrichota bacterium]